MINRTSMLQRVKLSMGLYDFRPVGGGSIFCQQLGAGSSIGGENVWGTRQRRMSLHPALNRAISI